MPNYNPLTLTAFRGEAVGATAGGPEDRRPGPRPVRRRPRDDTRGRHRVRSPGLLPREHDGEGGAGFCEWLRFKFTFSHRCYEMSSMNTYSCALNFSNWAHMFSVDLGRALRGGCVVPAPLLLRLRSC